MSVVHLGISFFVELLFLIWEFSKCMFWTVFYFVFSPTEKYVRNEIVLITGSAKGLGTCYFKLLSKTHLKFHSLKLLIIRR